MANGSSRASTSVKYSELITMKKIKKKKPSVQKMVPTFILGWTNGEPPPPGFLAAWFDRHYGGPLTIRFWGTVGHLHFDAVHTSWSAPIDLAPSEDQLNRWRASLQWDHEHIGIIGALSFTGQDRRDMVLHATRLAKGIGLLTGGTVFDVATGTYLNPSDWQERDLEVFGVEDHVQVEQYERIEGGRSWLHTRGLTKFGWDELEAFRGIGLTDQDCRQCLLDTAEALIRENRNPKVGEQIAIQREPWQVSVVRHRTDTHYGRSMAFREITWD